MQKLALLLLTSILMYSCSTSSTINDNKSHGIWDYTLDWWWDWSPDIQSWSRE